MPPNLTMQELNAVIARNNHGFDRVTHYAALLYTVLCQDLIRMSLTGNLDQYTQLHSDKLQIIFDDNYKRVIDQLLDADLLEVNTLSPCGEVKEGGYYSKTHKTAKSYRIPKRLLSDDKLFRKELIQVSNDTIPKVVFNKINNLNRVNHEGKPVDMYRQHVLNSMSNLVLLDDAATRRIIEVDCLKRGIQYSESLAVAVIDRFNHSPLLEPKVCMFAGRLHGLITQVTKGLRQQVRFGDDAAAELVEIDIVSSQPWFLSIISPELVKEFVPECEDAIPYFQQIEHEQELSMFRRLCADAEYNTENRYGIYDHFAVLYNKQYNASLTRNDAKRICYRAFFSDYAKKEKLSIKKCARTVNRRQKELVAKQNDHMVILGTNASRIVTVPEEVKQGVKNLKRAESKLFTQQCYELFREHFPHIHELFFRIKELKWDFSRKKLNGKKPKYYANNALLAQRLEANIVYNVIIKALLEHGVTHVVTIHDSFVVRKKEEVLVRQVIQQAFASKELHPILK